MPAKHFDDRIAWADRFQTPSVADLRLGVPTQPRHLLDTIRKHLLELDNVSESVAWYGDCWKWAIEYRTRLSPDPLAVLIPCPQDLQLALTLDRDFTSDLPIKRMKRAVRDGLELAQEPFDTRWSVWSLGNGGATSLGMLDDLQDIIELKLQHLAKRVG